jgi:hypothetical protein
MYAPALIYDSGMIYSWDQFYIDVIDVTPPETAHSVGYIPVYDPSGFDVAGGYMYLAGQEYASQGLTVVDIDPPESSHVVASIEPPYCSEVVVDGQYACTSTWSTFSIIKLW